jgi:glyoxylase-like metal-dependent hydrolase (beta-lactamase superfamily II)
MDDQTITILSTRWENSMLVRHRGSGLDVLIDFGVYASNVDRLCGMVEALGASADRIGAILMTHMHTDHYHGEGLLAFLDRRPAGSLPLPFYLHEEEPLVEPFDANRLDVRRFDDEPFAIPGPSGMLDVIPVRMSHSRACCGFRIGDDYIGGDGPTREVFGHRIMTVLGAFDGRSVRSMYVDLEAISVESIMRADIPETRKRTMLDSHGIVTDVIEAISRPELRPFFARLERLVPLHVTDLVNDVSGKTNACLIRDARDREGFTFEVPVVPMGFQDGKPETRDAKSDSNPKVLIDLTQAGPMSS